MKILEPVVQTPPISENDIFKPSFSKLELLERYELTSVLELKHPFGDWE
jgi:hypothetical protein